MILDADAHLIASAGDLAIKRTQEIPDSFLADLRRARSDASSAPAGEMHRVASIPVALVEHWTREGFDVYREPAKAIIARLQRENLDAFITSDKL
jgi:hypothetical protein